MAHHRAWTGKDLETAMTYIADDVVLDAPVRNDKIVYNRFNFDGLPFEEFQRRQAGDGVR